MKVYMIYDLGDDRYFSDNDSAEYPLFKSISDAEKFICKCADEDALDGNGEAWKNSCFDIIEYNVDIRESKKVKRVAVVASKHTLITKRT